MASDISPIAVDLKRASAMCGYSTKTLRRAIDSGELLAVRATHKIVVRVDDLNSYLDAHRVVPGPEASRNLVNKKVAVPGLPSGGQKKTPVRR
jgi:hypothetical protein